MKDFKYKNIPYIDKADSIYTRAIKYELKKHADNVDCYYHADVFRTPIFLQKLQPAKHKTDANSKMTHLLHYLKTQSYDFILIKSPYVWPVSFFQELSKSFPSIPIVNYHWSSVKMYNILPYRTFFTKVISFDINDCQQYGFEYYPLFYLHEFGELQNAIDKFFDLSFIGTGYSAGRISFMNKLVHKVSNENLNAFLYFYTPGQLKSLKLKLQHSAISNYCYWQQLSINEVFNVFKRSRTIIDHPMTIQTGLTIRTFETLGAGIHLFTTNRNIVREPFYDPSMVTVIDPDLSNFHPKEISTNPSLKTWQESFKQYRVDNWVKKIIGLD